MSNVNSFPTEAEVVEINGKVGVARREGGQWWFSFETS